MLTWAKCHYCGADIVRVRHLLKNHFVRVEMPYVYYRHKAGGDERRALVMTKDHIIPRSKGGRGASNLVPCCFPCNNAKADKYDGPPLADQPNRKVRRKYIREIKKNGYAGGWPDWVIVEKNNPPTS